MDKVSLLKEVYQEIHNCHDCPDVERSVTSRVVDINAVESKIVFMAQAPAASGVRKSGRHWVKEDESLTRGGEFLEKYLGLIGYSVDNTKSSLPRPYTTNALHCWTGTGKSGDRTPKKSELKNCMKWWNNELDVINPEILVLLGAQPLKAINIFTGRELKFAELINNQYEVINHNGKIIKLFGLPHPSIRPANKYYKIMDDKYNEMFNNIKKLLLN